MSGCKCGSPFVGCNGEQVTAVGYLSPPGHDHDDNCHTREYRCAAGHTTKIAIVRKCPACSWTGRRECFCCATFVDAWPGVRP